MAVLIAGAGVGPVAAFHDVPSNLRVWAGSRADETSAAKATTRKADEIMEAFRVLLNDVELFWKNEPR